MTSPEQQGEELPIGDLLEYYRDALSEAHMKLAVASAQIKKRDAEIQRIQEELRQARG